MEGGKGVCDLGVVAAAHQGAKPGIPCQLILASSILLLFAAVSGLCHSWFLGFFLRSSADGTVWSKNTEALPVPRWPL